LLLVVVPGDEIGDDDGDGDDPEADAAVFLDQDDPKGDATPAAFFFGDDMGEDPESLPFISGSVFLLSHTSTRSATTVSYDAIFENVPMTAATACRGD
jgi:hypothetical protein